MTRLFAAFAVTCAACARHDSARHDAAIDAEQRLVDATASICGDAGVSAWHEIFACGGLGEGDQLCVHLTIASGVITAVYGDTDQPPTTERLACLEQRLIGRCIEGYDGDAVVCAAGI